MIPYIKIIKSGPSVVVLCKGGEGSGHFGHEGRPGEVGGSGEGGGENLASAGKVTLGKITQDLSTGKWNDPLVPREAQNPAKVLLGDKHVGSIWKAMTRTTETSGRLVSGYIYQTGYKGITSDGKTKIGGMGGLPKKEAIRDLLVATGIKWDEASSLAGK